MIKASTLAIALGMILMVVSMATGVGLKKAIRDKIVGFTGHITISQYNINNSFEKQPILLDSALAQNLLALPGVKHIQPTATKAGILKGDKDFEGVVFKGVDRTYQSSFFEANIISGKWPVLNGNVRNDSILISATIANLLKIDLHDAIKMYFIQDPPRPPKIRTFYVCGIYATGLEEYDKTYLIGDLKHVQQLNRWRHGEAGGYEVILNDFKQLWPTTVEIRAQLPYDLDAQSVIGQNEQLFQWLDLFDLNIYLIIGIMVAVAVINMISALLILILDRTNMIGLLKSLGANNWQIIKIFLYQSASIIFRGLIWGNAIALSICLVQQYFGVIQLDPETYYVTQAPISLEPTSIILLNLGVILVCLVVLLIPALLISRISPVKALRYE